MSDKKQTNSNKKTSKNPQHGEKLLNLDDVSDYTVGEIVEKSNEITKEQEAGQENVLDRYIRQHRDEIETAKNKNLEDFVHAEREELEQASSAAESSAASTASSTAASGAESSASSENSASVSVQAKSSLAQSSSKSQTSQASLAETDLEQAIFEEKGGSAQKVVPAQSLAARTSPANSQAAVQTSSSSISSASSSSVAVSSSAAQSVKASEAPTSKAALAKHKQQFDKVNTAEPVIFSANDMLLDSLEGPASPEAPASAAAKAKKVSAKRSASSAAPKRSAASSQASSLASASVPASKAANHENKKVAPHSAQKAAGAALATAAVVSAAAQPQSAAALPRSASSAQSLRASHHVSSAASSSAALANAALQTSPESQPTRKNGRKRKVPIIIGACALILIAAGAIALANHNKSTQHHAIQTSQSESSSSYKLADFDKFYASFFTDTSETALKNASFADLPNLEKDLNKLTGSDYTKAQKQYNELKAEINAINEVNALFDSSAISDGNLDTKAKVKADVKLPTAPKTGNTTLNQLLSDAINQAKAQQSAQAKTQASQAASTAAAAAKSAAQAQSAAAQQASSAASTAASQPATSTTASGTPNNATARVLPQANLDTSNPAFTWAPGVEQKVISTCQARGYISGNNYQLIPVAIHTTNGSVSGEPAGIVSGYYNLYKPDGTYLVSINCKTGYWFGTQKGLPLDYSE